MQRAIEKENLRHLYLEILDASPIPTLLLLPDLPKFSVTAANTAYLKLFNTEKVNIINQGILDFFCNKVYSTDNTSLIPSIVNAFQTQENQIIDLQTYFFTSNIKSNNEFPLYWQINNKPILSSDGEVLFIVHNIIDYTEKFLYEKRLEEAELKSRFHFEINPYPMIIWDFETLNIVDVNEKAIECYGYSRKEFLQLNIKEIRPAEDIPLIMNATQDVKHYGLRHHRIWRHTKKSGEIMYMEINAHLTTINGRMVSINHNQDVTERLLAEMKLKESEAKYESLFNNANDAIFLAEKETGIITDVNNLACKLIGRSREEIIGMNQTFLHTSEDLLLYKEKFSAFVSDEPNNYIECDVLHKDGHRIPVVINGNTQIVGDKKFAVAYFHDITRRKEAESVIEKTTRLLNRAEEIAGIGSYETDENFDLRIWSKGFSKIMGFESENSLHSKNDFIDCIIPEDRKNHISWLEKLKSHIDINIPNEVTIIRKGDSAQRILSVHGIGVRDIFGEVYKKIVVIQDITERKEAENILKESENKYSAIFESANDSIFVADVETGIITDANNQASLLIGYTKNEITGKHQTFMHSEDEYEHSSSQFRAFVSDQTINSLETAILHKNGHRISVQITVGSPFILKGRMYAAAYFKDLTKEKEAEKVISRTTTLLQKAEEIANTGSVELDIKTKERIWSSGFRKIFGYKPEEDFSYLTDNLERIIPEDRPILFDWFNSNSKNEGEHLMEVRIVRKTDNSIRTLSVHAINVCDKEGNIVKKVAVINDITDKRLTEKTMKESEERYSALFMGASDAIFVADEIGMLMDANEKACKLIGRSREDLIDKHMSYLHAKEDLEFVFEQFKEFQNSKEYHSVECDVLHKDGHKIPVRITATKPFIVGEKRIQAAYFHDLTQVKEAETEVEKASRLLKKAEEIAKIGSVDIDVESGIRLYSDGFKKIIGIEEEDNVYYANEFLQRVVPYDQNRHLEWLNNLGLNNTDTLIPNEISILRKNDGAKRILSVHGISIKDDEGKIVKIIGVINDVTERKQLEADLIKSHHKLKKLTDKVPLGILQMDIIGQNTPIVSFVSKGIENIHTGLSPKAVLENSNILFECIYPEDLDLLVESSKECIDSLTDIEIEFRAIDIEKELKWIRLAYHPEKNEDGSSSLYGYFQDITKDKKLLESLEKQNKELKEIAWIQSHTVRAPLARMMGLADLMKRGKAKGMEGYFMENILSTCYELDVIIREIVEKANKVC